MNEKEPEEIIVEDQEDFPLKEKYYLYSNHYYTLEYGYPLLEVPKHIKNSKKFKKISPQRALQIFYKLGIQPNEGYLFAHALLLEVLPIPPGIDVDMKSVNPRYKFKGKWIENVFPPCYFYIRNNIEFLKEKYKDRTIKIDPFVFLDDLGREFESDLEDLYKKWLIFPNLRKLMEYNTNEVDTDLFKGSDIAKIKKDYDKKLRGIMEKNYGKNKEESKQISSSKLVIFIIIRCV